MLSRYKNIPAGSCESARNTIVEEIANALNFSEIERDSTSRYSKHQQRANTIRKVHVTRENVASIAIPFSLDLFRFNLLRLSLFTIWYFIYLLVAGRFVSVRRVSIHSSPLELPLSASHGVSLTLSANCKATPSVGTYLTFSHWFSLLLPTGTPRRT